MFQSSCTSWSSKIIARRDHRKEPADVGVAPALEVELRVVLEVHHALARRLVRVTLGLDEGARGGRHLVGVHLVAEHHEHVRPFLARLVAHPQRHRPQRVDLAAALVLVLGERVGRLVRGRHAAGAERDLERAVLRVGAELAGREAVVARPDTLPVEQHLVLVPRPRLEPAAADERVVVVAHAEGPLARAEHLDLAGRVGLDPDDGLGLADVAEQGSKHERGHGGTVPREIAFGSWSRSFRRWAGRSTRPCPGARGTRYGCSTSGPWSWPRRTPSCAPPCSASWT